MQNVKDFCEHLKYMALNRQSYYDNSFPANSCQIHDGGVISCDCIGLIKGIINDPDIWKRFKPVGYYAPIGKVIGDWTEEGIYRSGTYQSNDFSKLVPGCYMCITSDTGHAGIYVGDFYDSSGLVNTIECTTDFYDNCITTSYVDKSGRRFNHYGGSEWHRWEKHCRLTTFISYGSQPEPEKDVIYQTYDDVLGCWLENVEGLSDYAGIFGHDIDCVYANYSGCNLIYRVHTWSGDQWEKYPVGEWLPSVRNREDYAGIIGRPIDGFMIKTDNVNYKVEYRLHSRKKNIWYEWVSGYNISDPEYGYAGVIGDPADALQIRIKRV